MIWLCLGLLIWIGAHFFKRVLPNQREALGKWGRPAVAACLLVSIGLMIFGYREVEDLPLYDLPFEAWYINNLLMLAALFLMDAGRVNGVVRARIRHPMLVGVVLWSVAHLLVNGALAPVVLFGGIGLWALLQMALINRAVGPWEAPAVGSLVNDGKIAGIAVILYAAIVGIHYWLDRPAFVLL
jgi:uncharacterized membrane protein